MLASTFDLVMVRSGAGWPYWDDDVIRMTHDERSSERVVKVALYRSRPPGSASQKPGGTAALDWAARSSASSVSGHGASPCTVPGRH